MKVYLHTGAGKTGTSALQVALATLRPQLAAAGILYPAGFNGSDARAELGETTSGNAAILGGLVNAKQRRPGFDKPAVMAWLNACIAEAAGRDLLFSSEMMQFARADETAELCAFFAAAGYEVTVIHYVRHALDQAVAAYLQHLKHGMIGLIGSGEHEELPDRKSFLANEKTTYLLGLEPFAAVLPPERIIVRLYDKERADLVPGFLRLLRDTPFTVPPASNLINRSLTAAEQVVFFELSRLPDGVRPCRVIAGLTVNRPSSVPVVLSVTHEELADFTRRNQATVDAVNTRFLKGNGELLIKSERLLVGDIPPPPPDEVYAAFANCFVLIDTEIRTKLHEVRMADNAAKPRPPKAG